MNLLEWATVRDGEAVEFDGSEPTYITVRSFGACAVFLMDEGTGDDLLLGVGDSEEFTVELTLEEPHSLRFVLEASSLPAAFRARSMKPRVRDMSEDQPLVVIKPRIVQSEEMRMLMRLMQDQEQRHQRQLTEIANANPKLVDRSAVAGSARLADERGEHDRPLSPGATGGAGSPDDPAGGKPDDKPDGGKPDAG